MLRLSCYGERGESGHQRSCHMMLTPSSPRHVTGQSTQSALARLWANIRGSGCPGVLQLCSNVRSFLWTFSNIRFDFLRFACVSVDWMFVFPSWRASLVSCNQSEPWSLTSVRSPTNVSTARKLLFLDLDCRFLILNSVFHTYKPSDITVSSYGWKARNPWFWGGKSLGVGTWRHQVWWMTWRQGECSWFTT